jgi:chromatin remodeling complex protein RSC6
MAETKKGKTPAQKVQAPAQVQVPVPAPVAPPPQVSEPISTPAQSQEKKKRIRRQVTKETVDAGFKNIHDLLSKEIESSKTQKTRTGRTRFLTSIRKMLHILHNDYLRVQRCRPKRVHTGESGFMKPVLLDDKLLTFLGWEGGRAYKRNDVTKAVCEYIKVHELQYTEDRRRFVPDKALEDLGIVPKTEADGTKTFPYYLSLQKYLNAFYTKPEKTDA